MGNTYLGSIITWNIVGHVGTDTGAIPPSNPIIHRCDPAIVHGKLAAPWSLPMVMDCDRVFALAISAIVAAKLTVLVDKVKCLAAAVTVIETC